MTRRSDVEHGIVDEESVLEQIAALLEGGVEVGRWPDPLRASLALALEDASMSRTEGWTAVVLRRHLFGPRDVVPAAFAASPGSTAVDHQRAERLRSGLAACVGYRAGAYLLAG